MEYPLLVTWFLGGGSTTSYQAAFATSQACEIALSDLRSDARRLSSGRDTVRTITGPSTSDGEMAAPTDPTPVPVLSAVCVNQR